MGAAATQRGDASILRGLRAGIETSREISALAQALEVAEQCNAFVRSTQDYLVEPKGMRQTTIERARTRRGWAPRNERLAAAHCNWVNVDHRLTMAYHSASVRRAQAAYALLTYALGSWTIPEYINVPRAALPQS